MADREGVRFCSCSEVPERLDGATVEMVAEGAPKVEPGVGSARSARFCTCSDLPTGLDTEFDRREPLDRRGEGTAQKVEDVEVLDARVQSDAGSVRVDVGRGESSASRVTADAVAEPVISSVSDLLPGESSLFTATTHGKGGSEVVLTERRVLLRGGEDAPVLHASLRFGEIDSVSIVRAAPSRRSLIWGLIGFAASVGIWQALDGVGNIRLIMAAVVVLMSVVLLADYFLRPPDLEVVLQARSGTEMRIGFAQSHSEEADRLAANVLSMMEMHGRRNSAD